ncbi:glycosyltransferase family 9 protein [Streptomyces zingiberis]|uniref:Glycosyltransferase family 9 protein n=1 Tax=Streptomyces zingiberis TaxID=2053010 RepID=A0ABX1BWS0_9ACTN|nr:glycosyltransferase family 9 protein [Streptomyces zingiberis]NJQ00325.1 glycosyltransferase family 9 protein [Streptomyces zingiberis]
MTVRDIIDITAPPGTPSLLVLRALGLGDLLTAVPALRALRRAHPAHELVLAAPPRLAEAACATGTVDRLLPVSAPGGAAPARLDWTGPPPDLAVDLHAPGPGGARDGHRHPSAVDGEGPGGRAALRALRPRRLLGYARPGFPGPDWQHDEHERVRWCRLLEWYDIPADPADLCIPRPGRPSPAPGAVVLHPGAETAAHRWPADRYAAVARELLRAGHRVAVTAGAGEGEVAHAVAERAGLPAPAVFGGDADVPFADLAALVARARAVVTGDTGPAHLASALGTPSVVLFGPTTPRLWGPPESPLHRALRHPGGGPTARPGAVHGARPDERLLRITVEEVVAALATLPAPLGHLPDRDRSPARGVAA